MFDCFVEEIRIDNQLLDQQQQYLTTNQCIVLLIFFLLFNLWISNVNYDNNICWQIPIVFLMRVYIHLTSREYLTSRRKKQYRKDRCSYLFSIVDVDFFKSLTKWISRDEEEEEEKNKLIYECNVVMLIWGEEKRKTE